jgi:hypothetical protein
VTTLQYQRTLVNNFRRLGTGLAAGEHPQLILVCARKLAYEERIVCGTIGYKNRTMDEYLQMPLVRCGNRKSLQTHTRTCKVNVLKSVAQHDLCRHLLGQSAVDTHVTRPTANQMCPEEKLSVLCVRPKLCVVVRACEMNATWSWHGVPDTPLGNCNCEIKLNVSCVSTSKTFSLQRFADPLLF